MHEILKTFLVKLGTRKGCLHAIATWVQHYMEGLVRKIRVERKTKEDEKNERHVSLFADNMMVDLKNPEESK